MSFESPPNPKSSSETSSTNPVGSTESPPFEQAQTANGNSDGTNSQLERGGLVTFVFGRLQAVFFKGLFTLLPLLLTVFLLVWAIGSLEKTFGEPVLALLSDRLYVPGLGLLLALLIILAVGFLVENYLASTVLKKLESSLKRAPVIRAIYSPLKDLTDLFGRTRGPAGGQRVVFVQVMPGIEALGLVMRDRFDDIEGVSLRTPSRETQKEVSLPSNTRERRSSGEISISDSGTASKSTDSNPQAPIAVFIPFSYGFGGFTVLAYPEAIREAGIPADKALQLAITGWVKAR